MKHFACGSVVPGCTARFEDEDEDGLLRQVADHAERDHGISAVPPELVEQVRENITDRPAETP